MSVKHPLEQIPELVKTSWNVHRDQLYGVVGQMMSISPEAIRSVFSLSKSQETRFLRPRGSSGRDFCAV